MAGEPQLTEIAVIQKDGKGNRGRPLLSEITAVQRAVRSAWPPYLSEITIVQNMGALPPPPPPARPPTTRGPASPGRFGDIDCISNRMDVGRGSALDAWTTLPLPEDNYRTLEVRAWNKSLDIRWAPWNDPTTWTSPDEIPADSFKGFDGRVAAVQVRNHVLGDVARYQVIGFRKNQGWPERMLQSYLKQNYHATPPVSAQTELLSRLQPGGYLHTTFGPPGLNKLECDFLKLFEFNGDLVARVISKTGDALRWDVDGMVYVQDDWPVHVHNPALPNVITLTTTDGWSGVTSFRMSNNNITGEMPYFGDLDGMAYFYGDNNLSMVGVLPSFSGCTTMRVCQLYANWPGGQFTGTLPSFAGCTSLLILNVTWNDFSGETPPFATCPLIYLYLQGNSFATHAPDLPAVSRINLNVRYNSFNQTAIDNYLLDHEAIKTPMALSGNNYSILLQNNVPPSAVGLAAKQAIINEFLATPGSGTLTISHD